MVEFRLLSMFASSSSEMPPDGRLGIIPLEPVDDTWARFSSFFRRGHLNFGDILAKKLLRPCPGGGDVDIRYRSLLEFDLGKLELL